jgi:hypothetical protein
MCRLRWSRDVLDVREAFCPQQLLSKVLRRHAQSRVSAQSNARRFQRPFCMDSGNASDAESRATDRARKHPQHFSPLRVVF